jgi:hypothetical protein
VIITQTIEREREINRLKSTQSTDEFNFRLDSEDRVIYKRRKVDAAIIQRFLRIDVSKDSASLKPHQSHQE